MPPGANELRARIRSGRDRLFDDRAPIDRLQAFLQDVAVPTCARSRPRRRRAHLRARGCSAPCRIAARSRGSPRASLPQPSELPGSRASSIASCSYVGKIVGDELRQAHRPQLARRRRGSPWSRRRRSAAAGRRTARRWRWCPRCRARCRGRGRRAGVARDARRSVDTRREDQPRRSDAARGASRRRFAYVASDDGESHSTLPGTAASIRIQTSNTGGRILYALLKQQNTKARRAGRAPRVAASPDRRSRRVSLGV